MTHRQQGFEFHDENTSPVWEDKKSMLALSAQEMIDVAMEQGLLTQEDLMELWEYFNASEDPGHTWDATIEAWLGSISLHVQKDLYETITEWSKGLEKTIKGASRSAARKYTKKNGMSLSEAQHRAHFRISPPSETEKREKPHGLQLIDDAVSQGHISLRIKREIYDTWDQGDEPHTHDHRSSDEFFASLSPEQCAFLQEVINVCATHSNVTNITEAEALVWSKRRISSAQSDMRDAVDEIAF